MRTYDRLPNGSTGVTPRVAFVDDKLYAREFRTGDCVRKTGLRDFVLTPYVGRVLYSNTDTGVVQVQWPWGVENNTPSELVHDNSGDFGPPSHIDQSYSTYESSRWTSSPESEKNDAKWRSSLASSLVEEFESLTMPIYRAACKAWYDGTPELDALENLSGRFANSFGYDVVRRTVSNLYEHGRRVAIYWANSNRKYRATKSERDSGSLSCPRCASSLKPRVYRHGKRIMQCRACGFSIHNRDLMLK